MSTKHIKSKVKTDVNEIFMLTPKGCAAAALIDSIGFDGFDIERFDVFWTTFEDYMIKNRHVHKE